MLLGGRDKKRRAGLASVRGHHGKSCGMLLGKYSMVPGTFDLLALTQAID